MNEYNREDYWLNNYAFESDLPRTLKAHDINEFNHCFRLAYNKSQQETGYVKKAMLERLIKRYTTILAKLTQPAIDNEEAVEYNQTYLIAHRVELRNISRKIQEFSEVLARTDENFRRSYENAGLAFKDVDKGLKKNFFSKETTDHTAEIRAILFSAGGIVGTIIATASIGGATGFYTNPVGGVSTTITGVVGAGATIGLGMFGFFGGKEELFNQFESDCRSRCRSSFENN